MKINNYWKPKRTYKRKRKYNSKYAGTLTIRQKNINEKRAIITIAVVGVSAITYAFMMLSNNFTIDSNFVEAKAEARLSVSQQPVGDVLTPNSTSPQVVEVEIRKIAKEHNFKWENYLLRLAKCENRTLDPKAINDKGNTPIGSIDRGIFQINDYWHSEISDECAYSIRCSTEFAIDMINSGRQNEWVCNKIVLKNN